MNKTVLIIDDDNILRKTLANGLRNEHFSVVCAPSAETAQEILSRISPDAIILDRMMTGTDGLTLLKTLRKQGNYTPVIMLTAMTGADNTIDGLSGGADDYLAKPFQFRELVLRLGNVIKNNATIKTESPQMPYGLMYLDEEFYTDTPLHSRQILALSGEEKKLLTSLTTPIGNISTSAPMVAKRLRSKLNSVLSDIDIITIRGRGYKLICNPPHTNNKEEH